MASQKTIQYSTELKAFVVATAVVTMLLDSTTDYNFLVACTQLYNPLCDIFLQTYAISKLIMLE